MSRVRWTVGLALTLIACEYGAGTALAKHGQPVAVVQAPTLTTATVTRSDGYTVTLTGPTTARVGVATTYTATCGVPCGLGEFRAFGGVTNRLGEGFGRGASGSYVFRAAGAYSVRYRVGAACVGSPRLACPIDVWVTTVVA